MINLDGVTATCLDPRLGLEAPGEAGNLLSSHKCTPAVRSVPVHAKSLSLWPAKHLKKALLNDVAKGEVQTLKYPGPIGKCTTKT